LPNRSGAAKRRNVRHGDNGRRTGTGEPQAVRRPKLDTAMSSLHRSITGARLRKKENDRWP